MQFNFLKNKAFISVTLVCGFLVIFVFGVWVGKAGAYCVQQPEGINFSLFWDAYNKLKASFVDPEKIDDQKIIYGAIQGMTESLGDPYTSFFDPNEAQKFEDDLQGSFGGIGIEIGIKDNFIVVVAPLKDTPGEKAGIKSGDVISQIDGKSTAGMSTDDAVDLIRGKEGTDVTLTVYREEWGNTKDITITRGTIVIPAMDWKIINNDVAYIQLYQFGGSLSTDFGTAVNKIRQSGARKIILDLRNNPGGYLDTAQDIAGYFIQPGQVVAIEDYGDERGQDTYKTQGTYGLSDYPMVVLINGGSASASEILAGALRDNKGVQLIGEKSFGKGSVQEVIELDDGSFLKVTIAKWLTPKGVSISEVGLEPDIKVEFTEQDAKDDKDPQLQKALEIVNGLK